MIETPLDVTPPSKGGVNPSTKKFNYCQVVYKEYMVFEYEQSVNLN